VKTGLTQHTGLRQELRINPRLYQAMDMLYMPMMDLQQHLKQELLINPFLELLEPEEEEQQQDTATDQEKEKEKQEKEEEIDWEEILLNGFDVGGVRAQYEEQEYLEPACDSSSPT
jgi:RNA polymerase sigma-54 factor